MKFSNLIATLSDYIFWETLSLLCLKRFHQLIFQIFWIVEVYFTSIFLLKSSNKYLSLLNTVTLQFDFHGEKNVTSPNSLFSPLSLEVVIIYLVTIKKKKCKDWFALCNNGEWFNLFWNVTNTYSSTTRNCLNKQHTLSKSKPRTHKRTLLWCSHSRQRSVLFFCLEWKDCLTWKVKFRPSPQASHWFPTLCEPCLHH